MFSYNLSDTECLLFNPIPNGFELYSSAEGLSEKKKVAVYKAGEWLFENFSQQSTFWQLFSMYRNSFGKAFKAYHRSLKEKPAMYEFQCVRRRFSIRVTKVKRGWWQWMYNTFYENKYRF